MVRLLRAGRAGAILLMASALGASLGAAAGELPIRVLQRIHLEGATPVQAIAFGPGGKRLYAAVGGELRTYDAVSGGAGPVVRLPGVAVGLAAAARDRGTLYVATRSPARLLVLALRPLRITSSVAIGGGEPSALLYDSETDALFAESGAGRSVTRLDPATAKALGVVHLPGRLEQMASNGRGALYVANAADDELEAIDTGNMRRTGAIPLAGCTAPSGLAMDKVGRRLFVACGNGQALVIDEDMGFTFERLPIEHAASLRTVFTLRPLGADGWKGAAFIGGDGAALDAIQMKAFISYVGGGSLPLDGRCTALAVSAAARKLALALALRTAGAGGSGAGGSGAPPAGVELWLLGSANERVSP